MVISHNLLAMYSKRQLGITNKSKAKSTEKLSSGYRINRAADDAAGLAISEKMRRQIRGMSQGVENTQDGISLCQVADGALAEVNEMLNRMTKLSIQAANGTNSESDRAAIQREINELKVEITRIGKTTKFNDKLVFDNGVDEPLIISSITALVKCPGADKGYFSEAFKKDGKIYAAATLDFSEVDGTNIKYLYGKSFSFNCTQGCSEAFEFKFINGNGEKNSLVGKGRLDTHKYTIDIHGLEEGSQIVKKLFNYVKENPPRDDITFDAMEKELEVAHSNKMMMIDEDKLLIRGIDAYSTEDAARTAFVNSHKVGNKMGAIDCSEFTMDVDKVQGGQNITSIQTSGEANDRMDIVIDHMNTLILGLNTVDVSTRTGATKAIDKIKDASAIISNQRSRIGAYQNRLEHTIANENNIIENTTAAESQIRDTDMATEMVKYSNENILAQAGQSMLVQANQSIDGVLALLGNTEK